MDVKLTNLRLDDPDARCREEMFVGSAAWSTCKMQIVSLYNACLAFLRQKQICFDLTFLPELEALLPFLSEHQIQRNSDGKRCVPCAKSDVSWRSTARAATVTCRCHGLGPRRAESLAWRGAQRSSDLDIQSLEILNVSWKVSDFLQMENDFPEWARILGHGTEGATEKLREKARRFLGWRWNVK